MGPHPKKTVLAIFYREKTAMRAWFSIMRPVVWCYFVIRPVDRVMQQELLGVQWGRQEAWERLVPGVHLGGI